MIVRQSVFLAAIATLITLIGWIVSNYSSTNSFLLVVALIIGFFSGGFVIYQYRLIKELKDV
jgi:F0F1-type ATP synthase assembly protein I